MRRRMLLSNLKGDLPIVILVIGVFVISTLTLLNFYFEGFKDNNFFEGVILVEKVRAFSEDIKFYDHLNFNKDSLKFSGLSGKIADGNFEFEAEEDGKSYKIKGTFYEKSYFSKDKRLAYVEYNFPK